MSVSLNQEGIVIDLCDITEGCSPELRPRKDESERERMNFSERFDGPRGKQLVEDEIFIIGDI